jgi:hypothetical protein
MNGDKGPRLAEWAKEAKDFTDNPSRAKGLLSIGDVSDMTGLAKATIRDSLTRRQVSSPTARGAICRPYARIGEVPLWSPDQVTEYQRRASLANAQRANSDVLPLISIGEAAERGLITTKDICAMLGLHDQTLRRYERDDETYPPALARQSRDGQPGVPEHVRDRAEVLAWARDKESIGTPTDVDIPQQSVAAVEREDVTS